MKKLIILCAVALTTMLLLAGSCSQTSPPPPSLAPTPNPLNLSDPDRFPPDMLEIEWKASQPEYLPGQPVEIAISLTNVYDEPVVLNFPPEVLVLHHDLPGNMEDWTIRSYPSGIEQSIIDKSETVTYQFVWDQKDDDGEQVTPGHYSIVVYERPESQAGKKGRRPRGEFEVFIQYEQGAVEKTVEVNQQQTVSGMPMQRDGTKLLSDLTITLKTVELSAKRAQFYALATFPEYTYNGPHDYFPFHWISCADADYSFDGVAKDAGCADQRVDEEGIWLMWGYTNPRDQLPKDAKELAFKILIRLDDWHDESRAWYGPWEFKIPLE